MNKDVIYIDVDDDVTAIIGKIKNAKEKIVALVPPKRTGTLQSAVNLRLLERMAKNDKKQLVLITANQALIGLAANAQIPVAKNLQSKPELAEIPALVVDEGDDIIDGAELPVGEHAKTVKVKDGTRSTPADTRSDAIDATDLDIDGEDVAVTEKPTKTATKKGKNRPKIPNFDSFRKKLFLGIAGGVILIALLIWMFVFAPAARVIITASTSPAPVTASIRLGGTAATNYDQGIVSSITQQDKKDATLQFDATGQKDVGSQAGGTITITNCDGPGFTLSPGTIFTASGGKSYRSTAAVSVSALSGSASLCRNTGAGGGTGKVDVQAADSGDSYNIPPSSYSIQGVSGDIYAKGTAMSGGTSQVVKVVSPDDIERAKGQLIGGSTDDAKKALIKKFTNGEVVIDSSFNVQRGDAVSSPAVNQPAPDGRATLTVSTIYTIQAVPKADLDSYLKAYLNAKLDDKNNQKVYSSGVDSASIGDFKQDGNAMTATVNASGRIGPKIDESQIKDQVKGKRYGEVQQALQSVSGIKDVDVKFSYFWVRTVPTDTNKITIEFKVENGQ